MSIKILSSLAVLVILTGCAFNSDPISNVRQIAVSNKTEAQAESFQVIAEYPWANGTIIVYKIDDRVLHESMLPQAQGFATVNKNGQVLVWSEGLVAHPEHQQPLTINVGSMDTHQQTTMVYGTIQYTNAQTVTIQFQDGSHESVQPINNTYAVAKAGLATPCYVAAYDAEGNKLEKVSKGSLPAEPACMISETP